MTARRRPAWVALLLAGLNRISTKSAFIMVFLICAIPAGVLMAFLTPPGQAPDEPNHLARAAGLLHGAVLIIHHQQPDPDGGGRRYATAVKIDQGLRNASEGQTTMQGNIHKVHAGDLQAMRQIPADHGFTYVSIPNTAAYFPAAYLPATLGLAIGLAAKTSPFICFMLARFLMLLAFLTLGIVAIWIAAYGEAFLLGILLLPMSLFLAGTLNEDGVLIGLACVAAAALTHSAKLWGRRRLLGIAALMVVLATKPPYLPMLGFLLLPLAAEGFRQRAIQAGLAALPVLLWLAIIMHFTVVPFNKPSYQPGPLWQGSAGIMDRTNSAANLHILLMHPWLMVTLPIHTMALYGVQKVREMIGVLGVLQIEFSDSFYRGWAVALIIAWLGPLFIMRPRAGQRPILTAAYVLALPTLTYWAIMLSMYLSWTNVGENFIDGMQGRYAILLLPFFIFAIPSWPRRWSLPAIAPALPVIALGVFDIAKLPFVFAQFFYLH